MGNIDARREERLSPFRKISLGTWSEPVDPSIYGTLRLRMEPALAYLAAFRAHTGRKATVTHLVIKAVALALARCPEANAVLRLGTIYRRKHVDVSALVVLADGGRVDLSAAKVCRADEKSLAQICDELEARAEAIRGGRDPMLEGTRRSSAGCLAS
jgi:pyruvate/2-oxoglutarate dehydrogenase complex dihydrolipoamide acyltransferase (E2) component